MSARRILNKLSFNYYCSAILGRSLKPVQKSCHFIADQIKKKVWANGYSVTYDGMELRFPKNIGVSYCSNIFWLGTDGIESQVWTVLKKLIQRSDVFIDIGANIGLYSVLAKRLKPGIRVLSFEPIPSIFDHCCRFHAENGLSADHVHLLAPGDHPGTAEMYLPLDPESMKLETTATLRQDSWQARRAQKSALDVKVSTLDEFPLECGPGDKIVIKIDVEDAEALVLKGAEKLLGKLRPVVVCEILPRAHQNWDTLELLEANGYVAYAIMSNGLIRFHKNDFAMPRPFTDFLLLPAERDLGLSYVSCDVLEASVETFFRLAA